MPSRPDDAGNNEALLVWAERTRFAFRVDGARAPEFHAWVEDYHFDSDGPGTSLSVGIGSKPRRAFRLAAPVLPRALTLVLTRACHNRPLVPQAVIELWPLGVIDGARTS